MEVKGSFYFIRHGETRYNDEKRFQGSVDEPLNERGIEQAYIAAQNIINAHIDIDIIVSSNLKRARKTAEIIAEKINKPVISKEGLAEKGYGILEGTKIADLPNLLKENPGVFIDPTGLPELSGSEKYADFISRVEKSLNEVFAEYPNKKILIVAHTTVFASLYYDFTGKAEKADNGIPFLFDKLSDKWEIKKL